MQFQTLNNEEFARAQYVNLHYKWYENLIDAKDQHDVNHNLEKGGSCHVLCRYISKPGTEASGIVSRGFRARTRFYSLFFFGKGGMKT
jgi:hypothetical protein